MVTKKGYTLPEMMVTVAIIGVLALAAPPLMIHTNRFFSLNRAKVDIQREARSAMEIMNRNLRQAQSNTVVVGQLAGQPDFSRISFTKINGRNLSYYQDGVNLVMSDGAIQTILSRNLRFLAFSFPRVDDLTIVSISVTMEKATYQGKTKALHVASERVRVMN